MHTPTTVTANELQTIAAEERATVRYEARSNTDGKWAKVSTWSVIAGTAAGSTRHTYCVQTPEEALALFVREAERREGLGMPYRIIPDPGAYTQEIRIVPV